MTKRTKIIALAVIAVFLVAFITLIYLLTHPLIWNNRGELVETSVSPDGRWKVRLYYINPGAMASDGHRADVVDLKGKVSTRNIYLDVDDNEVETRNRWKTPNIVVLNGHEIDVRTESYNP